jgi:UDP-N-acetylmuramate dehydrogenase
MSRSPARAGEVLDAVAAALADFGPDAVTRSVHGSTLGTYRLGGPIDVLVRVESREVLARVSTVLAEHRPPVLVVGRGSNLLVADRGFAGVGIALTGDFEEIVVDAPAGRVRAGAAVALPVLARRSAAEGLAGLEFYVGIPGSVGGAVRMNAGGHGRETAEVLVGARVCDLFTPARGVLDLATEDLALGYRTSALRGGEVVVDAEFAVTPDDPGACHARIDDVVRWRREHQPGGANGGSVFRNPPGDSAGRLIEVSGCKGLRVGGAVVSDKHANFFQAEPGATADDLYRLIELVRARVVAATGIALETELVMVGFGEPG